ncbi:MAG: capsular biosynthesis protein [Gammaproteobacteria bacterium]|nr:capsular biosynthesis protein [Gammaproteobacteria bacterium]
MNHPSVAELAREFVDRGIDLKAVESGYTRRLYSLRLPGVQVLDTRNYRHANKIVNLNENKEVDISQTKFDEFKKCEIEFLTITDRLSFYPKSVKYRTYLYRQLLRYWLKYFMENDSIDMVLFREAPHVGYDIVIYYVARHFNIKTYYPEPTKLGFYYIMRKFHDKYEKVPENYLAGYQEEQIIKSIGKEEFSRVFYDVETAVDTAKNQAASGKQQVQLRKDEATFAQSMVRKVSNNIGRFTYWFRKRSLSVTDFDFGETSVLKYKFLALKRKRAVKELKRFYLDNCIEPELDNKFVFFALHLQPEKTSSPLLGGAFEDQAFALEVLSKSVPKEWIIYVKEHSLTFYSGFLAGNDFGLLHSVAQINCRSLKDYQRMLDLPNVKFVRPEYSSQTLIDKAEATATITGTAGWQSLLAKKCCIAFGYPWYVGCNSVYRVASTEECVMAMAHINEKSSIDTWLDLLKFIAYYKSIFIYLEDFSCHYKNENLRQRASKQNVTEFMSYFSNQ